MKNKIMSIDEFESFMSATCVKLQGLDRNQLAKFVFTIAKCANYYYEKK